MKVSWASWAYPKSSKSLTKNGVSKNGGTQKWMVSKGHLIKMDDDWGYPFFRKPPFEYHGDLDPTSEVSYLPRGSPQSSRRTSCPRRCRAHRRTSLITWTRLGATYGCCSMAVESAGKHGLKHRVSPVRIGLQYGLTTKNGGLNGGSKIKNRASTSKMGCLLKSWYLEKLRASKQLVVTVVNS